MPLVIATMMTHVVSLVGMLVLVPEATVLVTMRPVLLLEATVLVMAPASGRCHTTSFALHARAPESLARLPARMHPVWPAPTLRRPACLWVATCELPCV